MRDSLNITRFFPTPTSTPNSLIPNFMTPTPEHLKIGPGSTKKHAIPAITTTTLAHVKMTPTPAILKTTPNPNSDRTKF